MWFQCSDCFENHIDSFVMSVIFGFCPEIYINLNKDIQKSEEYNFGSKIIKIDRIIQFWIQNGSYDTILDPKLYHTIHFGSETVSYDTILDPKLYRMIQFWIQNGSFDTILDPKTNLRVISSIVPVSHSSCDIMKGNSSSCSIPSSLSALIDSLIDKSYSLASA